MWDARRPEPFDAQVGDPFLEAGTAAGQQDAGVDAAAGLGRPGPCDQDATYGDPLPPPDARAASWVAGDFKFLEGPVWHAALGQLFFTDMGYEKAGPDGLPSRILRFTPPDLVSVLDPASFTNGLALALDGRLLAATHDSRSLSLFDPETGARETRHLRYMGSRFNAPNDLTVHSDGTVYFTDPTWQLGPRDSEIDFTGVYQVDIDGEVALIDSTLDMPNGIALSPDERTLYVGSRDPEIMAYSIDRAGVPGTGRVFASPGSSDGLAIDCAGNLYVTAGDVVVYSPAGEELGRVVVDEEPANVAFGRDDGRTLFITAENSLYQIALNVPGYPY